MQVSAHSYYFHLLLNLHTQTLMCLRLDIQRSTKEKTKSIKPKLRETTLNI